MTDMSTKIGVAHGDTHFYGCSYLSTLEHGQDIEEDLAR